MELELNRIDYCSVGATLPNCMKLMPALRHKEQQRVCRIIFTFTFTFSSFLNRKKLKFDFGVDRLGGCG